MRLGASLALFATAILAATVQAERLDGSVYLFPIGTEPNFRSVGSVRFLNDLNGETTEPLSGSHEVHGPFEFEHPVFGAGKYFYIFEGPADAGECYETSLYASADPIGFRGPYSETWWGPEAKCATESGEEEDHYHEWGGTPIVINLAGGRWEFGDSSEPITFDLDADGVAENWTWTARESQVAFLAMDRNGNGRIDDGRELFGDQSNHTNGFELLKAYDDSHDGQITSDDAVWPRLLLWLDANHNGTSEPQELSSVASSPIDALGLSYHSTAREDRGGSAFRYAALVHAAGRVEPYYDVIFRRIE